jgi:glycosyltransferase involved in cell wall biosynthesis
VGGIPELLDASELVPAGDAAALAAKIQELLSDPLRMEAISRRNLTIAREYRDSVLSERRREFYQVVRNLTEQWEVSQGLCQ